MRKQNSIILACFIISVLLSGCGIKGPLTQKPAEEKTQKQKNNAETEQNTNLSTKQPQEN
ncbi:MAG: lipoprotein [Colwellia sp.]|nr:lipoprotein [Colwellia sp.]